MPNTIWSSQGSEPYVVEKAALSPDGKRLVVLTDQSVLVLYNLEAYESNEVETPKAASSVVWVGDDKLCIGFYSGELLVINADEGTSIEYNFFSDENDSSEGKSNIGILSLRLLTTNMNGCDGDSLWVMYDGGRLLVIAIAQVFNIFIHPP